MQAMLWYGRAAEHGDAFAMSRLASLHDDGPVSRRNPVESLKWRMLASKFSLGPADEAGDQERLRKSMNGQQIEEAERRAAEWVTTFRARAQQSAGRRPQ